MICNCYFFHNISYFEKNKIYTPIHMLCIKFLPNKQFISIYDYYYNRFPKPFSMHQDLQFVLLIWLAALMNSLFWIYYFFDEMAFFIFFIFYNIFYCIIRNKFLYALNSIIVYLYGVYIYIVFFSKDQFSTIFFFYIWNCVLLYIVHIQMGIYRRCFKCRSSSSGCLSFF